MYAPVQAGDEATAAAEEPCVDARALEAAKADESLAGALEGEAALPSVGRRWLRFPLGAGRKLRLRARQRDGCLLLRGGRRGAGCSTGQPIKHALA